MMNWMLPYGTLLGGNRLAETGDHKSRFEYGSSVPVQMRSALRSLYSRPRSTLVAHR